MTETLTAENASSVEQPTVAASGNWGAWPDETAVISRHFRLPTVGVGLLAASAFANAAEFPTDVTPPRNGATLESIFQPVVQRRITFAEALRVSAEIMKRAESGRERAALEEAARAFDLELD